MDPKYLPDFRYIIPMILGLMTVTTLLPLPHQVQHSQTQQEQAQ